MFIVRTMLANSLVVMQRLSALSLDGGNEKSPCKKPAPAGRDKYPCLYTWRDPMKLREIVDDLELQRFDALKDNAKRANQELQDALARLKAAKAKLEMLKARASSAI